MTQPFRTPAGGRIDRTRPIEFRFDGANYTGYAGDTLASALLANDVHLVGRSFKYHRPRGIFSTGAEEPNALVTLDHGDGGPADGDRNPGIHSAGGRPTGNQAAHGNRPAGRVTPNLRATQIELYAGLQARSQNNWPSLRCDLGAAADRLSPLLAAGFYYKTFMWPRSWWRRWYEPAIRAAAGLGRAPAAPDPDHYQHHYAHCDVLVTGAGPAGLAAALAASASGARVILCDEQAELGGSLLAATDVTIDGKPTALWLRETISDLAARDNVTLLPRTTAFGWYPDNFIGLAERVTDHLAAPDPNLPRERLWQVRAAEVVIAAGAIERPLVFPHNDRPGIMLADAARGYLQRYGVRVGARAVVATAHDSAYRAALALHAAGVTIAAIADLRPAAGGAWQQMARAAGITVHAATAVTGTRGRLRLREVRLTGTSTAIPCDTLLVCGGWTPSVHLFSQSRGRLRFDATIGAFVPGASVARERSAGACAGECDLTACLDAGYAAGAAAVRHHAPSRHFLVVDAAAAPAPFVATTSRAEASSVAAPRAAMQTASRTATPAAAGDATSAAPHGKAFVDFQNDVTTKDLAIAAREGFRSVEHVKRYTTAGMATDQGKTSNINALATVAGLLHTPIPDIGHTSFRPPYTPVTFGTFAGAARGALSDPVRRTPLHDRAAALGAMFENVGAWQRARCFPRAGEDLHAAVARECRAVRNAVGVLDASTLGKIEVAGPDAAELLDRLYTIDVAALAPGRCRYALLLQENGFVLDDGVIARLAHDRFHLTTTTTGAARVLHHMEDYRQTEFSELRAWLTSVTEHWAVLALQGPFARAVLAPLTDDIDLARMPHMSVREGHVAGVPARVFRVSFTGEPGYELNVPADYAPAVWDAVLNAGAAHGITPYGTEAMHVLRAEKGYAMIGQETDGTVTPDDLGLGWMIARSKRDFVGKRSLALPDLRRGDRRQLVGLRTEDPHLVLEEGSQVIAAPQTAAPVASLGHVTSAYWSDTLQCSIALALLAGGRSRHGDTLCVPLPNGAIAAQVCEPVFYDRDGARLHG